MNWSKFDTTVLITMSIAVISMAFVMPALGLTDTGTSEDDIPEFEVDSERFDFVGDFPDRPGSPATGTLTIDNSDVNASNYETFISGTQWLVLIPEEETEQPIDDPLMGVALIDVATGDSDEYAFNESEVGDSTLLEYEDYEVLVTLKDVENFGEPDLTWSIEYQIQDEPDDEDGWVDRIPIVGTTVSVTAEIAGMVGWIGSILFWGIGTFFEISLNLIGLLYDSVDFFISTITWLTGTYAEVVSSANSWAGVFVAIPMLLLTIQLGKLVLVGVSLLPTT